MLNYEKVTENDLDELIKFYRIYLNDGSNVDKYVSEGINSEHFVGYKCCSDGKMVGVLTARYGIDFTYPHKELNDDISALCKGKSIYTLDAIAVIPEYRKSGVASEITRLVMKQIKEYGGELSLMEMWIHPNGYIPVYKMFDVYGKYIYNKEVPLFYKDLKRYGFTCPICGEECRCGALIRVMELY